MMTTEDTVTEISSPGDPASPLNSTGDPESPLSPPLMDHGDQEPIVSALCAEYSQEDKVYSNNHPDVKIAAVLNAQSKHLWKQFDALGTEMIVTRRGRRMFPPLKIELFDLNPTSHYVLLMDMAPVDKYRYKYQNSNWVKCFEEECSPTRLYVHPDSPALGAHWMNTIINFYKLKLTNNQLDKQGHIIVNSMHRYQPRLHVVESSDVNNLTWENFHTFIFPGTQFTTVTAYQNDKITQLKIENNPFAKGFRSPFSRCRTRNQHHSFPLRSNSDSGPDELRSPPNIFHPHFLLPPNHVQEQNGHITALKRKLDSQSEEGASQKRICLIPPTSEQGYVKVPVSQIISASHPATAISHSSMPGNGTPVFIIYKPMVQPQSQSPKTPSPTIVHPGLSGATFVQTTNGQILNGATIFQAPTTTGADAQVVSGMVISSQGSPAAIFPQSPKLNGTVIRNASQQQPTSIFNGATMLQGSPTLVNGTTILQANAQPLSMVQKFSHPQTAVFSMPSYTQASSTRAVQHVMSVATVAEASVSPKVQSPKAVQVIDITNLTKEANHGHKSPPPPLLQVSALDNTRSDRDTLSAPQVQVKEFPRVFKSNGSQSSFTNGSIVGQSVMLPGSKNGLQKYFVVAEKPDSSMLILSAAQQSDTSHLKTQYIPVTAYDQEFATTMPIYRFNSLNGVQPIQILTPVAAPGSITTA